MDDRCGGAARCHPERLDVEAADEALAPVAAGVRLDVALVPRHAKWWVGELGDEEVEVGVGRQAVHGDVHNLDRADGVDGHRAGGGFGAGRGHDVQGGGRRPPVEHGGVGRGRAYIAGPVARERKQRAGTVASHQDCGRRGGSSKAAGGEAKAQGSYKEISLSDTAVLMSYSHKVFIVPGYGLAVAQAQHACHELEKLLESKGVEVKYAIHPVAGRMPGHMNVLLAESNVSYDKLIEMEDINPEFATTDVVLVVGANDVVNPAAKTDPSSPIYGMPILEVDKAKHIIVNKRSMNAGYAGIDNLLFYDPKTSMLFGDAKKALTELVAELKTM